MPHLTLGARPAPVPSPLPLGGCRLAAARPATALAALAFAAAAGVAMTGCSTEKAATNRACPPDCDQPKIPPGVPAFQVVKDEVKGPSDGQDVLIRVVLKQKTKRDDVYPALHFLYRYAMTRNTFEPRNFTGEFYNSESDASSGSNVAAKVWREHSDKGPKCENAIKLELPEQVAKAFAYSLNRGEPEDLEDTCHLNEKKKVERFDDKFTHKPTYKVEAASKGVEIQYPYLETGKDEYVKEVSFNSAMTYWAEFMTTMFSKAPDLQQITYLGVLSDEPVLKITVTRQEFDSKLTTVQETISSFAAITFAKLGLHKLDDKGAQKEQEAFKTQTYSTALSFLPKDRVMVSPKLKKSTGKIKK